MSAQLEPAHGDPNRFLVNHLHSHSATTTVSRAQWSGVLLLSQWVDGYAKQIFKNNNEKEHFCRDRANAKAASPDNVHCLIGGLSTKPYCDLDSNLGWCRHTAEYVPLYYYQLSQLATWVRDSSCRFIQSITVIHQDQYQNQFRPFCTLYEVIESPDCKVSCHKWDDIAGVLSAHLHAFSKFTMSVKVALTQFQTWLAGLSHNAEHMITVRC